MFRIIMVAAALGLLLPGWGFAQDAVKAGDLVVSGAWARATPKGATIGGGYMKITNNGSMPDRLIAGSTPVAAKFELHEMSLEGGIMKMRPLANGIEIKPGQTVELKPGGLHVMFVDLKRPLEKGGHLKVTLQFEKAGKAEVDYAIAAAGAAAPGGHTPGMKH